MSSVSTEAGRSDPRRRPVSRPSLPESPPTAVSRAIPLDWAHEPTLCPVAPTSSSRTVVLSKTLIARCSSSSATRGRRLNRLPNEALGAVEGFHHKRRRRPGSPIVRPCQRVRLPSCWALLLLQRSQLASSHTRADTAAVTQRPGASQRSSSRASQCRCTSSATGCVDDLTLRRVANARGPGVSPAARGVWRLCPATPKGPNQGF